MIGKVVIGKSFRGCLQYCLNDKLEQNQDSEQIMKDRAEILLFNQCYGNEKELIQQFKEVRELNTKLEKAVLHITLSFAPGEQLTKHQLAEICEDCAKDMGFEQNQFVGILHKDTQHQHVHIVANRVGFDGKTVSDSNSYKKIAAHCRSMELKHGLQQVLSPRQYLKPELRNELRIDTRKEVLKEHIKQSLAGSNNYAEFVGKMQALNYEVVKSRGIAFRDAQKVYTKGSDVGFSLRKIETLLDMKPELKMQTLVKMHQQTMAILQVQHHQQKATTPAQKQHIPEQGREQQRPEKGQEGMPVGNDLQKAMTKTLEILLMPAYVDESINQELLEEDRRRRRQQQRSLGL